MLIINIKDKLTVSFRKGGYSKDNTSILLSQKNASCCKTNMENGTLNTLLLMDDNCVQLEGFKSIVSNLYLSFRMNGISISPTPMYVMNEETYQVVNKKIHSSKLWHRLEELGYENNHFFTENDGIYYCLNPGK